MDAARPGRVLDLAPSMSVRHQDWQKLIGKD